MSKEGREEWGRSILWFGLVQVSKEGREERGRTILWFGLGQVSKEGREEWGEEYSLVWAGTSE